MIRRLRAGAVALALVLCVPAVQTSASAHGTARAPAHDTTGAPAHGTGHGWVGTWEAAPTRDTADTFAGYSIRNVVRVSVGGAATRIRLSNRFGTTALTFGHVTVARRASGADGSAASPGTVRDVTFAGRSSVTAGPGTDVVSDPVALPVPARTDLLVSVYLPTQTGPVTYHALAGQTSYLAPGGDHAADVSGTAYPQQRSSWFYVTGVDVLNPLAHGSVVAFGDSITDGYGSTYGADHRWPDFLADRLADRTFGPHLGVLNAGISGNRLLLPPLVDAFGPPASERLDGDVLSRTGARTVIVLEGINDIQQSPHQTDPAKINAALRAIADRAHARGLRVIAGTLTPFKGWPAYTGELEAVRLAVNDFIRTSRAFDGVVDFDAAVRDPADPHRILPAYDCGDHLHPNDAGYRAMADVVEPRQL
ncbi:SGNH/GDSL hydrolase family protein [Planosporangium mesophilum]|uniref:SGNH hydrolase n=1 Tax=Planosporangium mesophilum TaxID=689768 RepID=A0A8J3T5P7_9ACTN|nr:SGNH/GDSL hydrolase family protein [Planosporangium mesophilum]NJC81612.1 SGNH/GDSL hydrolase family protein [Planosporangium mesophilum]GII20728.1 SGNH hydrolase [Planosporangium mesophilum]